VEKVMSEMISDNAIVEGIRTVAVGRRGSRACSAELVRRILADLEAERVDPVQRAGFFAALAMKGVSPEERPLAQVVSLCDMESFLGKVLGDVPEWVGAICTRLLKGEELSSPDAQEVGRFLFDQSPGDTARAFIATVLRMRYATLDEYEGLYKAMRATRSPAFSLPVPEGAPIVQLADPFDGASRSLLLTPLLADWLQGNGYRVWNAVGASSGPKFGVNGRDLAIALGARFARNSAELSTPTPRFGWYVDQSRLSPAVFRWVELRKKLLKRPFLATLEKYLHPRGADIFVGSAFHQGFADKGLELAPRAGFRAAVVVFKAKEGTLGLSLGRTAEYRCVVRRLDGSSVQHSFSCRPHDFGIEAAREPAIEAPTAAQNAEAILRFLAEGSSGDLVFDLCARYTVAAFRKAFTWIERELVTNAPIAKNFE